MWCETVLFHTLDAAQTAPAWPGLPRLIVLLYLLLVNLWAFALMGFDKRRSKRPGARRVRERTLFFAALLGGSVGAVLGMRVFHHKTKHWHFVWGMPAILALHVALGFVLWFNFIR